MASKSPKKKTYMHLTPEGEELLRRATAEPGPKRVATINSAEIDRLAMIGAGISKAARETVAAAERIIAGNEDPDRKQLHRKVVLLVYDASGTRITSTDWDLKDDDELHIDIGQEHGVTSEVRNPTR